MDNREEEEASYPPRILLLRNLISLVHASRTFSCKFNTAPTRYIEASHRLASGLLEKRPKESRCCRIMKHFFKVYASREQTARIKTALPFD